jgi:c-di-AMP phosphodiesterase-like protein
VAASRFSDSDKQVFVVKKQEKEKLTVLDTLPEDNARQTDHGICLSFGMAVTERPCYSLRRYAQS